MKFKNEKLELGTRFFLFTAEDEYKIVSLVKSEEESGQFMNEETLELETISEKELDKYTMLSEYETWFICQLKTVSGMNIWTYNQYVLNFFDNKGQPIYEVQSMFTIAVYKFMKKSVFDKLINYIMNLNYKISLSDSDCNEIWSLYFMNIHKDIRIFEDSFLRLNGNLNMKDVINNNAKIPDSLLDAIEENFNTYILTYDVYEYDDSVNLYNVNMKYFVIYNNDKYYIVLYVEDTARLARETQENLEKHMDVVNFMLK